MNYILVLIAIAIFFWLLLSQHFIITIGFALVVVLYIFYRLSKGNPQINNEDATLQPLVDEVKEGVKCYLYKLDYTLNYKEAIARAIFFDNSTTLGDNNFNGLTDDEIKIEYRDGTKVYQYNDDFGIRDFQLGNLVEDKGLEVLANDNGDYLVVGYVSLLDCDFVNKNRDNIKSVRLIYHGGYYKCVVENEFHISKVETGFEDYVLTLAICYND